MTQLILTTPPPLAAFFERHGNHEPSPFADLAHLTGTMPFVTSDPAGRRLGSGGGTVRALAEAWKAQGKPADLTDWLSRSKLLVLHSGGESRRLPAYAAIGKALMPMPAASHVDGAGLGKRLVDFQVPAFKECLERAGSKACVLIASGDVWLDFDAAQTPALDADIAGIGMKVTASVAHHFGVYFVEQGSKGGTATPISFFRQKPAVSELNHLGRTHDYYVDTGIWVLSVEAVLFLFSVCGWNGKSFDTEDGEPAYLDLYTEVGNHLGLEATPPKKLAEHGFGRLTATVLPVERARFHHLGSNRQLLESCEDISQSHGSRETGFLSTLDKSRLLSPERASVWASQCLQTVQVRLEGDNLLTGLPEKATIAHLARGACLETLPIKGKKWILRPYGIDDTNRGLPGEGAKICGRDALQWAKERGITLPKGDIFDAPIYPVVSEVEIGQEWLEWFFAETPSRALTHRHQAIRKASAREIPELVDFATFFEQERRGCLEEIKAGFDRLLNDGDEEILKRDGAHIAALAKDTPLGAWLCSNAPDIRKRAHSIQALSRFTMILSVVSKAHQGIKLRSQAFSQLQDGLVGKNRLTPSVPKRVLKDDQIVWARSPVRLDLSGGWTDTPPYCLEAGGSVLNLAVLLNGQPPIQAFVRQTTVPNLIVRSIDQGAAEIVTDYTELADFKNPRGNFSLPKAAFALAGFLPAFQGEQKFKSLRRHLEALGGGFEISMLSAVPKGSGLGTSSILAATLLASLNRACGLGWDEFDLYNRVMAVEQLLTTGGGWQDQAGALFSSIKLIETGPGMDQRPTVKYLPTQLFGPDLVNRRLLLYYTGVTRMAKGILQEIVHSMFLGEATTIRTLASIRANTDALYKAIQRNDATAFDSCIARSWILNKQLDSGTTTPEVESILERCGEDLSAAKLLGAGGGGYMLICAKSGAAGDRIRQKLEQNPTNPRARFIDFSLSEKGVEVTVS